MNEVWVKYQGSSSLKAKKSADKAWGKMKLL